MSWSHVNSNKAGGSGAGAANITLTSCQQGDLLLWIGSDGDGAGNDWEGTGVTDDAGNTYRQCCFMKADSSNQDIAIWFARHATGAGTVVVNGPEGNAFAGYIAAAYRHSSGTSAVPVLDGVAGKETPNSSGTDAWVSPPVASHSTDGLAIGVHLNDEAPATLAAGTGYTLRQSQDIFSTNPLILEDKGVGVGTVASTSSPSASTFGQAVTLVFTVASLLPTQTISQIPVSSDESGYRTAATWSGITSGAFTADTGLTEIWMSSSFSTAYFSDCTVMRFNTGAIIPSNAVIQWARVVKRITQVSVADGTIGWKADYYDFGGSPMIAADWTSFLYNSGTTNIFFENYSKQGRGNWNVTKSWWLKDLSGIKRAGQVNPQGFTGYTGIREAPSRDTMTPTGQNFQVVAADEHATEPAVYLEVAWFTPPSPTMLYHEAFTDELWTNSFQGTPTLIPWTSGPVQQNTVSGQPSSLQINPAGATEYVFYESFSSFGESPTRICAGFWFYLNALPAANREIAAVSINLSDEAVVGVSSAGEIWISRDGGTGLTGTGKIIPIQTWVWVELMVDVSANPWLLGVQVDGASETWITNASAATNLNSGHLHIGPTGSTTLTAYYGLPHYAIPTTDYGWMGAQTWPWALSYVGSNADISGSGDGITADLSSFSGDLSVGDTILFGVHVLDSVKASVASSNGAVRVTDWVTGPSADTYGVPAYSVWKVLYAGVTDQYTFSWTDTGGRGAAITAIAFLGDQGVAQFVTGTSAESTAQRTSPTIDATPGSTVVAFQGGSAANALPTRWKAPSWPMEEEEFYGVNSVALVTGASGLSVTSMPSSEASMSMWILVELGVPAAPPPAPTFLPPARVI